MAKKNSYDLAASSRRSWKTELRRDWVVYLLFLPIIMYEVVLHYRITTSSTATSTPPGWG